MVVFEQTTTIKKDGKQITNNIEQGLIIIDDDIYENYCILGVEDDKVLIKQGNTIKYLETVPDSINCIISELLKVNNKPKKTTSKKENKKDKE